MDKKGSRGHQGFDVAYLPRIGGTKKTEIHVVQPSTVLQSKCMKTYDRVATLPVAFLHRFSMGQSHKTEN